MKEFIVFIEWLDTCRSLWRFAAAFPTCKSTSGRYYGVPD